MKAKILLQDCQIKPTKNRVAILEFLLANHGPFSVDEIHVKLDGFCDLVTVYRTIEILENARLVQRCDFRDGQLRYESYGAGRAHHHHIVCRKCQKVQSVAICVPDSWKAELSEAGFTDVSHSLEFFGVCRAC